ncbi:hypothetical protein SPFL3102_00346 [Sporomusaceae bacterium FL31]|nr:hypothetical protein SPFL3101_01838 [Sporomusaceae bacterium FL31]GCE32561.1 hypothetical protein SPFL3102_00346 [Sporomusaceae bacterium]
MRELAQYGMQLKDHSSKSFFVIIGMNVHSYYDKKIYSNW